MIRHPAQHQFLDDSSKVTLTTGFYSMTPVAPRGLECDQPNDYQALVCCNDR
jgi:hypothetical protein